EPPPCVSASSPFSPSRCWAWGSRPAMTAMPRPRPVRARAMPAPSWWKPSGSSRAPANAASSAASVRASRAISAFGFPARSPSAWSSRASGSAAASRWHGWIPPISRCRSNRRKPNWRPPRSTSTPAKSRTSAHSISGTPAGRPRRPSISRSPAPPI
ncbi:hypothetical protein OY671_010386, partial [Metschnikowia pulcherrima]